MRFSVAASETSLERRPSSWISNSRAWARAASACSRAWPVTARRSSRSVSRSVRRSSSRSSCADAASSSCLRAGQRLQRALALDLQLGGIAIDAVQAQRRLLAARAGGLDQSMRFRIIAVHGLDSLLDGVALGLGGRHLQAQCRAVAPRPD